MVLRPKGAVYDLDYLYQQVNEQYFSAKLQLHISWFGGGVKPPKTRMVFGSYHQDKRLIKINRLLDREEVPEYFIRYVIYHEMLHAVYPPIKKKGRRKIHHATFKEQEKRFLEHSLAMDYVKQQEWFHV